MGEESAQEVIKKIQQKIASHVTGEELQKEVILIMTNALTEHPDRYAYVIPVAVMMAKQMGAVLARHDDLLTKP